MNDSEERGNPAEPRRLAVGGIAGGFYRLFELLGKVFLSMMIGWRKASHPKLERAAVRAGGVLAMTPFGWVYGLRLVADTRSGPLWVTVPLAVSSLAAVAGFLLASVLIFYARARDET